MFSQASCTPRPLVHLRARECHLYSWSIVADLHEARERNNVAPGDGHTVYLPIPEMVDFRFGLLMRDLGVA